ncbi:MAG: hypothetical protein QNJ20_08080 [Paracoccaceae bacterium]|nr:hypothetical protein [Paracoccaceae bacterium]
MKAMLTGFAAIVILSVAAYYGLQQMGFSSKDVYSSENVRLD